MKKTALLTILVLLLSMGFAACAADRPTGQPTAAPSVTAGETAPSGVPARPGSGATGDPSAHLDELTEASGTVKEVKEGLVLITTPSGSDFMLRFSGNSKWDEGVDKTISVGNTITCLVKPEPTFTTPSQGEVYRVTGNKRP